MTYYSKPMLERHCSSAETLDSVSELTLLRLGRSSSASATSSSSSSSKCDQYRSSEVRGLLAQGPMGSVQNFVPGSGTALMSPLLNVLV